MQLKREVPKRSVRQIIKVLELEGFAEPGVLKPSTMQRHLYDAGFGRKQMKRYAEKRAVSSRRFCQPHRMEIGAFTSKVPPVPLGMTGSIPVERGCIHPPDRGRPGEAWEGKNTCCYTCQILS